MSLPSSVDTLRILSNRTNQHQKDTETNPAEQNTDSSDEESGSNCPTFTTSYDQWGSEAVQSMANFTPKKFTRVRLLIAEYDASIWNTGRERNFHVRDRYALPQLVTVLKHKHHWNLIARLFGMNESTFERFTVGFFNAVLDQTHKVYVQRTVENWKAFKCVWNKKMFRNFDCACYATDLTFQQGCRLSGSATENK